MSFLKSISRVACAMFLGLLLAGSVGAGTAQARWYKAESDRFIVYSDGAPGRLQTFVQKLETFDRLLRWRMGLDAGEASDRKLPIYLVDGAAGINSVWPTAGTGGIAGFYSADGEDIFAVARRDAEDDTLLHEYAHHFMMQYFPYGYPGWFIEGFAEYFGTVDIEPERIIVGNFNRNRGMWLRESSWLPTRELLGKRFGQVTKHRNTYYPLAWLLTHWFMGTESRHSQLNAYLLDVGAGGDPVEAMPRATGMSNAALRAELRRYMSRLPYFEMPNRFPPAAVTVTEMPAWADDLLLLSVKVTQGDHKERRGSLAAEARRAAARHPDEPFAHVILGHAEIHFGDRDAGEAVLRRLIEQHPDNLDAHLLLARSLLERAEKDEAGRTALKAQAQQLLARAYGLDDADYRVFMLLGEVREGVPGYPTENDIATRETALALAPQLDEARLKLAEAYLAANRNADAIRTAVPLANDPHAGEDATKAAALITRARGLTEEQARAEEAAADAAGAAEDAEEGE